MKYLFAVLFFLATLSQGQITVSAPTASPVAGTYSTSQSVVLSTSTVGPTTPTQPNQPYAPILPWLVGGAPTFQAGQYYSTPITVGATQTIESYAYLPVIQQSPSTSCVQSTGVNCGESQTATQSSTSPWPEWKAPCVISGPTCGGGTQTPASFTQAMVTTPSLSGHAIQFGQVATSTVGQYNSLFVYDAAGPGTQPHMCNPSSGVFNCTHFYQDYWVYFQAIGGVQNLNRFENDTNDFDSVNSFEIVWGMQCNFTAGVWQYGTQSSTNWVSSSVPCNNGHHGISGPTNIPDNTWIHIQTGTSISGHTCLANSTAVGGGSGSAPCQSWDYLAITPLGGGTTVYNNWATIRAAQSPSSFTLVGPQFQIDMDCGSSCVSNIFVDGGGTGQSAFFTAGDISTTSTFAYTITGIPPASPSQVTAIVLN